MRSFVGPLVVALGVITFSYFSPSSYKTSLSSLSFFPSHSTPTTRPPTTHSTMATNPVQEFNDVFPVLADELIAHLRSIHIPENAIEWFDRVCFSLLFLLFYSRYLFFYFPCRDAFILVIRNVCCLCSRKKNTDLFAVLFSSLAPAFELDRF